MGEEVMDAVAEFEVVGESSEFFAPTSFDLIDSLLSQYQAMRKRIEGIAELIDQETSAAISYFLDGNRERDRGIPSVDRLFRKEGAIAALNSAYWSKAMQLTDVLNYMPQKRRDEWNKSITEQSCPEFEESTVRDTLSGLLGMRHQFLAERVDGIFRGLSGEHVTNSPAAFGKRMIVGYVLNDWGSANYSKTGLINDLRSVIAKFMGRDEPGYSASDGLISAMRGQWGEWVNVDGGALKIRLYKKGTAHIEVHPDMAWRLNQVLSHLYPLAIPPEFRTKPKKAAKTVQILQRPLPFAVINVLSGMKQATRLIKQEDNWRQPIRHEKIANALEFGHYGALDKHIGAQVRDVLESIGGVRVENYWQFDYSPFDVLGEIVASGCIPDQKAHQFYPTPASIAEIAVSLAAITEESLVLEPSAGQGGLADFLPKERTTCVEISALHCDILKAKGFNTIQADFMEWAATAPKFDRVVMNPPFSEGRAKAHLEAATGLVNQGGRIVAILPASFKGKDVLPGWNVSWSEVYSGEFAGTSVSVVMLVGEL